MGKQKTRKRWVRVGPGQPPVENPQQLRWVRQFPSSTPNTGEAKIATVGHLRRQLERAIDRKLASLGDDEKAALARSRGKRLVIDKSEHVPGSRDVGGEKVGLIVERADGTEVRSDGGSALAKSGEERVSFADVLDQPSFDGVGYRPIPSAGDFGDGVSPLK